MIPLSHIQKEYLRSFALDESDASNDTSKASSSEQAVHLQATIQKGKLSVEDIPPMDEREQSEVAFSKILNHSKELSKKLAQEKEPVLDEYSWQDLNLIAGNTTTPDKNALNYIKKTCTTMGSCVMATQMVNPTTDAKEIASKQKVTQEFLDNESVAEEIDASLQQIQKTEALGFSLWREDHHLNHKEYKKELDRHYYHRFGLDKLNSYPWVLQIKKLWKDLWLHPILGAALLIFVFYTLFLGSTHPFYALAAFIARKSGNLREYQTLLVNMQHSWKDHFLFFFQRDIIFPFITLLSSTSVPDPTNPMLTKKVWTFQYYYDFLKSNQNISFKLTLVTILLGQALLGLYFVYKAYKKYLRNKSIINFLADHLMPAQDLVLQARKISEIVANNHVLEKHYGQHLQATRALLNDSQRPIDEGGLLLQYLQKVNLHSRAYFFRYTGRLLTTYHLFKKHKAILADIHYEMGLVDAQLSIYKLMKNAQKRGGTNQFILGNTQENAHDMPMLIMKGMWHFGLDAQEAIPNDIMMDSKEGPRTIITTGPNAGGKSTYIIGAGLSAVLYQVYGIAAAESLIQPIFHKIITYINPVQNLAAGLSLAEAGMEVLKKHKKIFEKVKKPILAIIDEILNGTDPKVAAEYSYKILEQRNEEYSNCLTLLTTHLMNLTKLAKKSKLVRNQKVVVKVPGKNNRKFDYTYKIEPGITDQNIVEDMLTDKGII